LVLPNVLLLIAFTRYYKFDVHTQKTMFILLPTGSMLGIIINITKYITI